MKLSHRLLTWLIILVLDCGMAGIAGAEDTEVYVGLSAGENAVQPNVLFIIDTSGSMATMVTITAPYDPSKDYTGACKNTWVYWSNSSEVPSCENNDNYFDKANLVCAKAKTSLFGLGASGFYEDRMAQWRKKTNSNGTVKNGSTRRWRNIKDKSHYVECEADQGIDGVNASSPEKWITNKKDSAAKNGNARKTGWTKNSANAKDWSGVGQQVTLYSANHLNWYNNTDNQTTQRSRLDIVKSAATDLIGNMQGVNVGLMRFDKSAHNPDSGGPVSNQGGPVLVPISNLDTNQTVLDTAISKLDPPVGSTPLAETYWEATLYYRGETPLFGSDSDPLSVSTSKSGGKYKSPIVNACGKNYIVYLTDGLPEYDKSADSAINSALSSAVLQSSPSCGHGDSRFATYQDNDIYGSSCFDDLAGYLYQTDSSSTLEGTQNIVTYTIGFGTANGIENLDEILLQSAASKGGGAYYRVENARQLSSAFNDVITRILSVNTTFSSPAVTVNAFNRLVNNNDVYFTVFRPSGRTHWDGNVKRYKLDLVTDTQGGSVDADNNGMQDIGIFDATNKPAVDPLTGFFADDSRSFWTLGTEPDGKEARLGGLADRLYNFVSDNHVAASRNVYTYTGTTKTLTDATNKVTKSNANTATNTTGKLTKAMFGVAGDNDADFVDLIKWASGIDLNDDDDDAAVNDGRPIMGAPLHSKPVIVTYGTRGTGSSAYQDDTLFVTTNDGYFHAATVRDPAGNTNKLEDFAYLPPDQLPRLDALKTNAEAADIQYGLDGPLGVWMNDANNDGGIENSDGSIQSGEHLYVYFGERRGGHVYHALDVTDRANPKWLWTIDPDSAGPNDPFSRLGQTWSKPVHRRMELNGATRDVLIFGGGYDPGHDDADTPRDETGDDEGNALYIVDAKTGALLWWASDSPVGTANPDLTIAGLKYSIPAGVRAIDTNADHLIDTILAGDTGGQLLRFDVSSSGITGGVIADLQIAAAGDTPLAADNRLFYESPDVTLVEPTGQAPYLTIGIGSGYRAHPLNTAVNDRAYILRAPVTGVTPYTLVYEGNLLDVTDIITDADFDGLGQTKQDQLNKGWYIRLEGAGEKVLAESLTLGGRMLFTTYIPPDPNVSINQQTCAPNQGTGQLYTVNFLTGQPVLESGQVVDASLTKSDRSEALTKPGIPPAPVAVVPDLGDGTRGVILVGPQVVDGNGRTLARSYWHENNVHE